MKSAVGLTVLVLASFTVATHNIGRHCQIHNKTSITCSCIGSEEFFLPDGYDYANVTSLRLTSCDSANLHYTTMLAANQTKEIIVQNISGRLNFELSLTSKRVKTLKLSNIRRVPLITHDTFLTLSSIETLWIEDTFIERFEEEFTGVAVTNFFLINVTIEHIDGVDFLEKGSNTLRIVNSVLRNVGGQLNFAYFSKVEITDSTFELRSPGKVLIEGDVVSIQNSVFSNASVNVVAASSIAVKGTCADGKSSLRLSSSKIESFDNRLPTEIVYKETKQLANLNNTVCIAGDCKCPKRSGQSSVFFAFVSEVLILPFIFAFSWDEVFRIRYK